MMSGDIKNENSTVQIVIGSDKFQCSKEVLMANSDYFQAMFTSNMREAKEDSIELQEVDAAAFHVLLDFMESKTSKIDDQNMYEVMKAAMMYQVNDILPICKSFILSKLHIDSAVEIYVFADTFSANKIYNMARHLILWNFSALKCHDSLLILSTEQFIDLITESQLRVSSEEEVIDSIFWYLKQKGASKRLASQILLESSWMQYLSSDVLSQDKVSGYFAAYKDIFNTLKEWCCDTNRELKKREMEIGTLLYAPWTQDVNGHVTRTLPKLVLYDNDSFTDFDEVPNDLHPNMNWDQDTGLGVTLDGYTLYFVGGAADLYRSRWYKDVWSYDLLRKEWKLVTELSNPRRHHGQCIVGDFLYVMGGIGKHRVKQSSMEKYNINTGEWFDCKPLPSAGYKVTTWIKDNIITASMNSAPNSHTMYLYDINTDTWQEVPTSDERVKQIVDGAGDRGAIDTILPHDEATFTFGLDESNQPAKFCRWISFVPCFRDFRKT